MKNRERHFLRRLVVLLLLQTTLVTCHQSILLWHGMGDSCDGSMSMILDVIETHVVDARVHCVGRGVLGSFFGKVTNQVDAVCADIRKRGDFDGYIGIGFSQGGLFMRALAQKCDVPMKKLISIGGPQMGVVSLPSCVVPTSSIYCKAMDYIIDHIGFFQLFQNSIVQAQYLYSPVEPMTSSQFLADINGHVDGERQCREYSRRIVQLQRLVLFQFTNDTMVEPPESSHFGFFNGYSIISLQQQQHVSKCLGLDTLMASNRLELRFIQGQHMQFTLDWFKKHVVEPYVEQTPAF